MSRTKTKLRDVLAIVNEDIAPLYARTDESQHNYAANWMIYVRECQARKKKPSREGFVEWLSKRFDDEGPRAS